MPERKWRESGRSGFDRSLSYKHLSTRMTRAGQAMARGPRGRKRRRRIESSRRSLGPHRQTGQSRQSSVGKSVGGGTGALLHSLPTWQSTEEPAGSESSREEKEKRKKSKSIQIMKSSHGGRNVSPLRPSAPVTAAYIVCKVMQQEYQSNRQAGQQQKKKKNKKKREKRKDFPTLGS